MTGEKNRYSSVEKLWKFDDETLKTPRHDEMVIWLLNVENLYSILPRFRMVIDREEEYFWALTSESEQLYTIFGYKGHSDNGRGFNQLWAQEIWNKLKEEDYDWEAIKDKDREFWKSLVTEYLRFISSSSPKLPKTEITSERPISTETGFIVGYWDIVVDIERICYMRSKEDHFKRKYTFDGKSEIYFIEVKPKIESFGATLRQLRTYQEYEEDSIGNTYLFTDDLRFKDAFESQGIHVISRQNVKDCCEKEKKE